MILVLFLRVRFTLYLRHFALLSGSQGGGGWTGVRSARRRYGGDFPAPSLLGDRGPRGAAGRAARRATEIHTEKTEEKKKNNEKQKEKEARRDRGPRPLATSSGGKRRNTHGDSF